MSFEKDVSALNQTKKKELQQGEFSVQKFGAFFLHSRAAGKRSSAGLAAKSESYLLRTSTCQGPRVFLMDSNLAWRFKIPVALVVRNDQNYVGAGEAGMTPATRNGKRRREHGHPGRDGFQEISTLHVDSLQVPAIIVMAGALKVNQESMSAWGKFLIIGLDKRRLSAYDDNDNDIQYR